MKHNELIENFQPNDVFYHKDSRPFVWAHFIRRDLIKDVRFDESLDIGEDQEFIIRYMTNCKRILFWDKKLYIHYNVKDSSFNSVAEDRQKMCHEHIRIVKKVLSYIDIESPEFAEWLFDTLSTYCSDDMDFDQLKEIQNILKRHNVKDQLTSNPRCEFIS